MNKWALLAERTESLKSEKEELARRIAYSSYVLYFACVQIVEQYNANIERDELKLLLGECSFSGFTLVRADKRLRALVSTRPDHIEVQLISGYKFDPSEHRVAQDKYVVSVEGDVTFSTGTRALSPLLVAEKCCETLIGHSDD